MVNYVNNVLSSCKSQIQSHGIGLYFDENGKPVMFWKININNFKSKCKSIDIRLLQNIPDQNLSKKNIPG